MRTIFNIEYNLNSQNKSRQILKIQKRNDEQFN